MMLGKHANSQTIVEEAVAILKLELAHERLDQRGLTGTVRAYERDTRVQVDIDVDSGEDGVIRYPANVGLVKSAKWRGELLRVREHEDAGRVSNNLRHNIDSLDRLDSRLDESGTLRIIAELVNELLDVTDLFELSLTGSRSVLVLCTLGALELLEISLVVGQLLILEVHDFVDAGVEEVTSVGHDNHCSVHQLLDVVFKPDQGWQIQVIRGLIQHENLRLGKDDLCDRNSHSPTARELFRRLTQISLREADTCEDLDGF